MNSEELGRLHGDYRKAIEVMRDEDASPEARQEAQDKHMDLRHQIDAALIEDKATREEEDRQSAVEARLHTSKELGDMRPKSTFPMDKIKAFGESTQRDETLSFNMPMAAEWTTIGTTTNADNFVPETWASEVALFQIAQSGVLQAGPRILNTANGNQINYPTLTTDMSSAAHVEGSGTATETNAVFGTTPLNSYRVDGFTPISEELFRDSGVAIEPLLRELAARSLAAKAAPYYGDVDIGTGSSLPAAITLGTTLGVTALGVDSVTISEMKTLMKSVLPTYRMRGSFVVNSDISLELALMKDDLGRFLVQPAVSASEPDRLFGYPVYEDAYFDASATGNIPVVFGDFGAGYVVRRVGGVQVDLSRDFAFTGFEITARWAIWHDAASIDTIAVKHLILA